MSAIGKGDWVVAIAAPTCAEARRDGVTDLVIGRIYQVRACVVGVRPGGIIGDGLLLEEVLNPLAGGGVEWSYAIEAFRLIYRPKQELIESLLAPPKKAKGRAKEPA